MNERRGFPEAHPHDDLAVYAIDGLEGDERAAVEAHVATCAECQAELAAFQATLSLTIEDEQPPPWLWDQIAANARAVPPSPPTVTVLGDRVPAAGYEPPLHLQSRRPRRIVAALAAAAAVVVALLLAPAIADRVRDDDTEVVAEDLPVGTIAAEDGTPIARVEADNDGSFVRFDQATPLTPQQSYQLWSLDGPQPVSLGVLGTGADDAEIRISLPPSTTQVAISEEPASGSPQPTGAIVGTGSLAPA